jgi:NAD(P)-dependent dehydrogenase (short-subunit alcohol dehydrogenase family)
MQELLSLSTLVISRRLKALSKLKNVVAVHLDLADPSSVDQFSEEFIGSNLALDVLINNAGIMATQFATSPLGHFQLTARLWKVLKNAQNSRVETLSSFGHKFAGVALDDPNFTTRPYDKWAAYGQSKTANSLFSVELDRRSTEHGIRAFAVHPGRIVSTDLLCHMTDEEMKDFGVYRKNGVIKVVAAYGISV